MMADSSSSLGKVLKKACRKNTVKGRLLAVYWMIRHQRVPRCQWLRCRNQAGMKDSQPGIIMPAIKTK